MRKEPFNLGIAMHYDDLTNLRVREDFFGSSFVPWTGTAIGTGVYASVPGWTKYPGIYRFVSAATADSGYMMCTSMSNGHIPVTPGMKTIFLLQVRNITGTTVRMGFSNISGASLPLDGMMIEIKDGVVKGFTRNTLTGGGSYAYTGTSYAITVNTWYRFVIELNNAGTECTFKVYQDDSKNILWQDSTTQYIPTQILKHNIIATNSGTVSLDLIYLDYMEFIITKGRRVFS